MIPPVKPAITDVVPASSELGPSGDDEVQEIRDICLGLIAHFESTSSPPAGQDPALYNLCCQEAKLRGYSVEDPSLALFFATWIPCGISIASTAYGHLENPSLRLYIALYTAFLTYIDDSFASDVAGLAAFHIQFCKAESHGNMVLDFLSDFLRDTHVYYGDSMASTVIITAALNFITALFLEYHSKNIQLSPAAKRFPKYARGLSGIADAYSVFMFPPAVPVHSYVQALPGLMGVINGINDILSFYKEELAGDEQNLVSITARCSGSKKIAVVCDLAKEVIEEDRNVRLLLNSDSAALEAYKAFSKGYVAFHQCCPRYRLEELTEDKINTSRKLAILDIYELS